jgi:hypothetical protein
MVNLYDLEWQLIKKSNITNRSPKSNIDIKQHIDDLDQCDCGCKK